MPVLDNLAVLDANFIVFFFMSYVMPSLKCIELIAFNLPVFPILQAKPIRVRDSRDFAFALN